MTETARIRWEPLSSGPLLGYVTPGQWLFQIYKPSDDADSTELALMSYLPGQTGDYRYADDPGELKRAAERWLAGFVSSLGAVFPGPVPPRPDGGTPSRRGYRPYHAEACPARTELSGEPPCTCGGLKQPLWKPGDEPSDETTAATTAREKD